MTSDAFVRFWRTDLTRECFLSFAGQDELKNLRFTCRELGQNVAPKLFRHLTIHFSANTFSRHSRMVALERMGHHVKKLAFVMPHSHTTFLPPLMTPDTLEELTFIYEPHTSNSRPVSASSTSSGSKYGSWEIDDLLIKHYPPVFHAATNIPAFVRAFSALTSLRKLEIQCPGQDHGQRYRRDAVDFALISLRVAVEQANPCALDTLVLNPIHPGAAFSLRPQASYGSSPSSTRVWRRIKTMKIGMDSFTFGLHLPSDHLKILHTYLQAFPAMEHFDFEWLGDQGPCPLSLDAEPCTSRPSSLDSVNACPNSCTLPSCKPIRYRRLRTMHLRNATLDAEQAATFVKLHRKVLHEFNFDECSLRSGTWDEALAPLSRIAGNDKGKKQREEVMDVPLVLSPIEDKAEVECVLTKLWDDEHAAPSRGLQTLRKFGQRTKKMLPAHVKRLLQTARLGLQI
ncbi:uncharacterized protein HMPREF1541_00988 [Cyphellophora europaea CBS 101466]|uniref:Uncharacterized protein n=1 Tax=Cyphellophora europaea (strain CBS 101466) TaxID=1220924 RepID=W2SFX9_CYPE1|nr:uncharacterized protein HMPREF1541_00988 [Cyphellophora europaea CBS 101466]ETN46799.1 hypothetical protein HMPREF1541_00988 [Cyphellophora europaea CBS 101466]